MRIGTARSSTRLWASSRGGQRTTPLLREDFLKMSISTGPIASRPASSASAWLVLSPAARRSLRQMLLAVVLPVAVIALWQWAGNGGSLFGGVLPTPDRVWQGWKGGGLGPRGPTLHPFRGPWLCH